MRNHGRHDNRSCHHGAEPNPGLLGIFGGVINLTTTALRGGAKVVKTIVEGSVWHGSHCEGHCCDCCRPAYHYYYTECSPRTYRCRCCD